MDRSRLGFWLFAAQLLSLVAIAVSNVLLGLSVLCALWNVRRLRLSWLATAPLLLPLLAYLLVLVVSAVASYEPGTSLGGLGDLFALTPIPLALLFVRQEKDVRRLVDGLIVVGGLLAAAGLAQYVAGTGDLDLDRRIQGPLSHVQTFSGVLLLCDLLLITRIFFGPVRRRTWHWLALALINAALLGSLTRGPWVGLGVAVTLLILVRSPRYLLAYLPAALLLGILAPIPLFGRAVSIVDLRDASNYDRLCMAYAGLRMISERPLFGLGPELVRARYPIYRHPTAPRYSVPHLHNSFLQMASERGLLTLMSYLWLMGASLFLGYRAFRAEGGLVGRRADLYLGGMLALVAFNVAGFFEDNWRDTEVQRLAIFALVLPFCLTTDSRPPGDAR